jgi:hypothetical protein
MYRKASKRALRVVHPLGESKQKWTQPSAEKAEIDSAIEQIGVDSTSRTQRAKIASAMFLLIATLIVFFGLILFDEIRKSECEVEGGVVVLVQGGRNGWVCLHHRGVR